VQIDPLDSRYTAHYMEALNDITEGAAEGVFSWVMCRKLMATDAFIKTLESLDIILSTFTLDGVTKYGSIRSSNYSAGSEGFKIEYNGNSEFNNAVIKIGDSSQYIIIDGVDKSIRSSNFVPGVSGWKLYRNGDVEFSSGVFRGSLIIGGTWNTGGEPISTSRSPGINANKSWTSLVETILYGNTNIGFPYPGTPEPFINFRGTRTAYKAHKSYFKTDRYLHGSGTKTQLKNLLDDFNIPLGLYDYLPVTGTIAKEVGVASQGGTYYHYEQIILSFMTTQTNVYQFAGFNTYTGNQDTLNVTTGTDNVRYSFAFV
jgi:hypothetical protein